MKAILPLVIIISVTLIALSNLANADESDVTYSAGSITATGPLADTCGGATATATLTDSGVVDPTDPDCDSEFFEVTGGPNYSWAVTSGVGSVSGGASATWTYSPALTDDGPKSATITLTVSWTGTDCDGNNDSWSKTTTTSVSTTVHAVDSQACTVTAPSVSNPVGLPDMPVAFIVFETVTWEEIFLGIGHVSDNVSGTCKNVSGTESYEAVGGLGQPTGCDQPLDEWFTPSTWTLNTTIGFTIAGVDVSTTYTVTGSQTSNHIFNKAATPYTRWYGQKYNHFYTPTSSVFVGSITRSSDGTNPIYQTYEYHLSDGYSMLPSGGKYEVCQVGAACPARCCGLN